MPSLILSSGLKLAFEHYGDLNGIPAFYFHGWPSSGIQGAIMDEVGKKMGLHVVSMDRPGIGASDYQPGRELLDWPVVLKELAGHLAWKQFHVFGVSGGGPYALVSAYRFPDRVLSANVICGAPSLRLFGTKELFLPYRAALMLRDLMPWALGPIFKMAAILANYPLRWWPVSWVLHLFNEADRAALLHPLLGEVVKKSFQISARSGVGSLRTDGDIYTSDWGFELADIRVPVHFWHGKADRNIPWTYAEKAAAMIAHATTHWTDNDGHYSMAVSRVDEIVSHALTQS